MKHYDTKECTGKCHSEQHASDLIGLISKTSDPQTLLSGMLQCCNPQKVHDDSGRYIIHMAASCGRSELLEWLVQFKKADMNLKTLENGWTAAHCSAFHGHLDSLITLIKLGARRGIWPHEWCSQCKRSFGLASDQCDTCREPIGHCLCRCAF